jgi:hypothetical protein
MARGDPILCQDPGDVLQFANQTRSEALVALFDEGCSIKDLHVVEVLFLSFDHLSSLGLCV